ncbi:MAG: lipid A biosynthesis acyltransferase [Acidiferrobacterales bacterium]|nr:lipid A biosynthesis acyltransferase [Gammaproteobacteria bacterium]
MSRHWLGQSERGSKFMLRLITWIALRLGRAPARALLYPICGYFIVFSRRARRASRQYLERVLGRAVGIMEVCRHYHCFAATILDRVFLLGGRHEIFDIDAHGADVILQRVKKGEGCILLGSHLGSFEVLRTLGIAMAHLPIKILMYEENAQKVSEIIASLNPALSNSVIPIGTPDSMLRVKECLDQGELVGILGDRVAQDDKIVRCSFLGQPTHFPAGPMLLAAALGVPVILCFGLYRGGNRYEIYTELLADRIKISRTDRSGDLQRWTQRYVDRLEHYCRSAPYNWFNFYDYWAMAKR